MTDRNSRFARENRRLKKARLLLPPALEDVSGAWADLGCGDGIFTAVLQSYLQPNRTIYAVDRDKRALQKLMHSLSESQEDVTIHPIQADNQSDHPNNSPTAHRHLYYYSK